eukprot:2041473-Rhodomonas_salina.1
MIRHLQILYLIWRNSGSERESLLPVLGERKTWREIGSETLKVETDSEASLRGSATVWEAIEGLSCRPQADSERVTHCDRRTVTFKFTGKFKFKLSLPVTPGPGRLEDRVPVTALPVCWLITGGTGRDWPSLISSESRRDSRP